MLFDRVQFHLCISRSLKDTKDKPHFVHLLLYKKYLLLIDDKISGGVKDYILCNPSGQQQDLVDIENGQSFRKPSPQVSSPIAEIYAYDIYLERFVQFWPSTKSVTNFFILHRYSGFFHHARGSKSNRVPCISCSLV